MTDAVHASNLPPAMQRAIEASLFSLWIMVYNTRGAHTYWRDLKIVLHVQNERRRDPKRKVTDLLQEWADKHGVSYETARRSYYRLSKKTGKIKKDFS